MSFEDVARRFVEAPSGTDAFKTFYKSCYELMKSDTVNAGLYFLVAVAGQSFVRTYEDQGLTAEFVDSSKAILVDMNNKLLRALASEPAERLRLLGEVATAYEWQVTTF